jgi:plasmid stabilization system protein ParE
MSSAALLVVLTKRAERQLEDALMWWRTNRPGAPDLLLREMTRAVELLGLSPAIGSKARGERFVGVRRVLLEPVGYHLYYRVRPVLRRVEILAIWYAHRGQPPRIG